PTLPCKKPLPQVKVLGVRPAKPRRPPVVDLEKFKAAARPGTLVRPATEPPRSAQLVPHRRDGDEIYDDVESVGPPRRGQGFLLPAVSRPTEYPRPRGG
ncbi:hypothetical protein N311_08292, partial [Apaloderma vittatum]